MVRVKRGTTKAKRRRNLLGLVKGYRNSRSTKERAAREAYLHAGAHAFAHRRKKKGDFRRLWNVRINALAREEGLSYSALIHNLNTNDIRLNRKMLALLAREHPDVFRYVVQTCSGSGKTAEKPTAKKKTVAAKA